MNKDTYEITQFLIIEVADNDIAIMTENNVVNITNVNMINFFKEIEVYQKTDVDYYYIADFFMEETDEAIQFLLDNNLLKLKMKKELVYNKINFISNDIKIFELLSLNLRGIPVEFSVGYSKSINKTIEMLKKHDREKNYNIIILNPFSLKDLYTIVREIKVRNLMTKVVFFYNYSFYFTNIYKESWGTPCPICFFSNLESLLRGEAKFSACDNFQTIMDIIYSKKETFAVGYDYKEYQLSFLIANIISEVKELQECDINAVKRINMIDNSIQYDIGYHWELCDCYE